MTTESRSTRCYASFADSVVPSSWFRTLASEGRYDIRVMPGFTVIVESHTHDPLSACARVATSVPACGLHGVRLGTRRVIAPSVPSDLARTMQLQPTFHLLARLLLLQDLFQRVGTAIAELDRWHDSCFHSWLARQLHSSTAGTVRAYQRAGTALAECLGWHECCRASCLARLLLGTRPGTVYAEPTCRCDDHLNK